MSAAAPSLSALRVRDYMTSSLQTLNPDDRLIDAELLVRRSGVRHLPVVKDGNLIGLVTDRDVRRYAPSILDSTPDEYNKIFEQTVISTVMTKQVQTIRPDAPLAEAAEMLYAQHRGCLPVMEDGQLVGIITRRDLLRFANDILTGVRPLG